MASYRCYHGRLRRHFRADGLPLTGMLIVRKMDSSTLLRGEVLRDARSRASAAASTRPWWCGVAPGRARGDASSSPSFVPTRALAVGASALAATVVVAPWSPSAGAPVVVEEGLRWARAVVLSARAGDEDERVNAKAASSPSTDGTGEVEKAGEGLRGEAESAVEGELSAVMSRNPMVGETAGRAMRAAMRTSSSAATSRAIASAIQRC